MTLLDETYGRLNGTGFEYDGGLSNHGPMAAEALLRLGFADQVEPWVDRYLPRLRDDVPRPGGPLESRSGLLGDFSRVADWTAAAAADLEEQPWQQVLASWLPALAPGAVAAAGHGLIRTAHAVRALTEEQTPERRRELAAGLGYWAARWQRLPGQPDLTGTNGLRQALAALPHVEPDRSGLITFGLLALDAVPAFPAAVESLGAGDPDLPRLLSALTAAAASALVAGPARDSIGLVHAVTVPAAVRLLLAELPAELHRPAVAAAWQASAALLATRTHPRPVPTHDRDMDEIAARAVCTGDEHAIKYVEACRREDALAPDPVYGSAAAVLVSRVESR